MATMNAVCIHEFGGLEVLRIDHVERPEPGPNEVLVEIHATSVNPIDCKIRSGAFPAQLPKILGRDMSGMVVRAGSNVQQFKPGDAVYALLDRDHGGYAEYVTLNESLCSAKPTTIDYSTAAAVPLAALTAWQGLFDHGHLQPKQSVLIHGGAGGVGHFAIQFAKYAGAHVSTTVSGEDIDFVRGLGADRIIDYHTQPFEDYVQRLDLVFDLVGGETQKRSWSVLEPGGTLVSTLGQPPQTEANKHHVHAVGYMTHPDASQLAQITRLIDHGVVHPVVQAKYVLAQVRAAQQRAEREHTVGKVVIDVIEPAAA